MLLVTTILSFKRRGIESNWKLFRSFSKFCGLNWINSLTRRLKIKPRNKKNISSTVEVSNFFSHQQK